MDQFFRSYQQMKFTLVVFLLISVSSCSLITTLKSRVAASNSGASHLQAGLPLELLTPIVEKGVDIASKPAEALMEFQVARLKEVLNNGLAGVTAFKDKARPLTLIVSNPTDKRYRLLDIDFKEGKPYKHPTIWSFLEPMSSMVFYVSNKDVSMNGVTGFVYFQSETDPSSMGFGVSFSHPSTGAVKAKAAFVDNFPPGFALPFPKSVWLKAASQKLWDCMQDTTNPGISREDLDGLPVLQADLRFIEHFNQNWKCT